MAFFEDPEDSILFEFDPARNGVEFEFRDGMISMWFPKEFFKRSPEVHQYFNAEDAIIHMSAYELENLRKKIAPALDSLNLELEEQNKTLNKKLFNQMLLFKKEHEEANAKHSGVVKELHNQIDSLSKLNMKYAKEISDLKDKNTIEPFNFC